MFAPGRDGVDTLRGLPRARLGRSFFAIINERARARALLNSRDRKRLHATRRIAEGCRCRDQAAEISTVDFVPRSSPRYYRETIVSPRVMDKHVRLSRSAKETEKRSSESFERRSGAESLDRLCFFVRERRFPESVFIGSRPYFPLTNSPRILKRCTDVCTEARPCARDLVRVIPLGWIRRRRYRRGTFLPFLSPLSFLFHCLPRVPRRMKSVRRAGSAGGRRIRCYSAKGKRRYFSRRCPRNEAAAHL